MNNSSNYTLYEKGLATFWIAAMPLNHIVDFFTQGLSDFLALETFRHGTTFHNYVNIRVRGADPSYGGTGCAQGNSYYVSQSKGYFHVVNDSEAFLSESGTFCSILQARWLTAPYFKRVSYTLFTNNESIGERLLRYTKAALTVLFVPTIKFRYDLKESKQIFKIDPDTGDISESERMAILLFEGRNPKQQEIILKAISELKKTTSLGLKTNKALPTYRIGLIGIFEATMRNDNTWERMKQHPGKVCWGAIKVLNPVGLILLGMYGIYSLLYKSTDSKQAISMA